MHPASGSIERGYFGEIDDHLNLWRQEYRLKMEKVTSILKAKDMDQMAEQVSSLFKRKNKVPDPFEKYIHPPSEQTESSNYQLSNDGGHKHEHGIDQLTILAHEDEYTSPFRDGQSLEEAQRMRNLKFPTTGTHSGGISEEAKRRVDDVADLKTFGKSDAKHKKQLEKLSKKEQELQYLRDSQKIVDVRGQQEAHPKRLHLKPVEKEAVLLDEENTRVEEETVPTEKEAVTTASTPVEAEPTPVEAEPVVEDIFLDEIDQMSLLNGDTNASSESIIIAVGDPGSLDPVRLAATLPPINKIPVADSGSVLADVTTNKSIASSRKSSQARRVGSQGPAQKSVHAGDSSLQKEANFDGAKPSKKSASAEKSKSNQKSANSSDSRSVFSSLKSTISHSTHKNVEPNEDLLNAPQVSYRPKKRGLFKVLKRGDRQAKHPVANPTDPEYVVLTDRGYVSKAVYEKLERDEKEHVLRLAQLDSEDAERYEQAARAYEEKLQALDAKLAHINAETEKLRAEKLNTHNLVDVSLSKKMMDAKAQQANEKNALRKELEARKQQILEAQKSAVEKQASIQPEIDELNYLNQGNSIELEECSKEVAQLRQAITDANNEIDSLARKGADIEASITLLQEKKKRLEEEISVSQELAEKNHATFASLEKQQDTEARQLEERFSELSENLSGIQVENARKKQEIDALEREIAELKNNNKPQSLHLKEEVTSPTQKMSLEPNAAISGPSYTAVSQAPTYEIPSVRPQDAVPRSLPNEKQVQDDLNLNANLSNDSKSTKDNSVYEYETVEEIVMVDEGSSDAPSRLIVVPLET